LLLECRSELTGASPQWSVNGVVNGNTSVGTITTITGVERIASYTAPHALPTPNPVAVQAQFDVGTSRTVLVSNITVVDALRVYEGTAFGRASTRISNEEQWVEMSANLRFTYNPQLSVAGDLWYDGTGTAYVHGKPIGCDSGSAMVSVQSASLVLHTEGPLAGTYALGAAALAEVRLTCGDPPQRLTIPIAGGIGAGGGGAGDNCPTLSIGQDPDHLSGAWSCTVSDGSTMRANWTLRAVE